LRQHAYYHNFLSHPERSRFARGNFLHLEIARFSVRPGEDSTPKSDLHARRASCGAERVHPGNC
jgi:hypothetical protein